MHIPDLQHQPYHRIHGPLSLVDCQDPRVAHHGQWKQVFHDKYPHTFSLQKIDRQFPSHPAGCITLQPNERHEVILAPCDPQHHDPLRPTHEIFHERAHFFRKNPEHHNQLCSAALHGLALSFKDVVDHAKGDHVMVPSLHIPHMNQHLFQFGMYLEKSPPTQPASTDDGQG